MTDLKSMTLPEMTGFLQSLGEPAFRGKQVFTWLHRGVTSFDEMTNLSKVLREKLKGTCVITDPKVARKQVSRLDGTIKYLWELSDGNCIETVLMQYHHGNTVCISSQVGVPDGVRLLRLHHRRKGPGFDSVGDAGTRCSSPSWTPACRCPTSC